MAHDHHHAPANYNRAFALGVLLNVAFIVIEVTYGILADSLALIADAGHNAGDVMGLLLAWGASALAARGSTERRTYGFRKATVVAALASAILLLAAVGGIAWEAVGRLSAPQAVSGWTVVVVAAIGVVINAFTALLFVRGQKHDLNLRGAFLHMAADAAVSLGVVLSGLLILSFGWHWVDPAVSLLVAAVIFVATWGLLRDSINYTIDAVPRDTDLPGIRAYLLGLDGVADLHDLHVWPLSTSEVALTVHLVVEDGTPDGDFLAGLQEHLHREFGIGHSTVQVEPASGDNPCRLNCC